MKPSIGDAVLGASLFAYCVLIASHTEGEPRAFVFGCAAMIPIRGFSLLVARWLFRDMP